MITVYVSTTPSPLVSRADHEVNLNTGDTLPVDVQLYAAATDSDDPSAVFTFSWHLLRKPDGSGAALDNALIAEPILEGVDVWGNYSLFCIATNPASGATSQRDPLQAGSSAFTKVYVRSENLALVKPAAGERDWHPRSHEWVDAIENMDSTVQDHETRITDLEAATPSLALSDLTDVALTSLSVGESLVWDGADWTNQVVSGGSGSGTLAVKAGANTGSVDVATESLAFTGSSGVSITGNDLTAGQYTVNVALASTLAVDISGNATTATSAGSADVAIQLDTPNVLSLSGDLSGSATIGGTNFAPTLNATIGTGVVENAMLQNSGITFGTATDSEVISLGQGLVFAGTTNEVEVAYSTATNTLTVGLPTNIAANAASADVLSTTRTISLASGATGSASFNGGSNATITATLATPTTTLRGGVLLDQPTAFGNTDGNILNRERVVLNSFVDNTHFENSSVSNHATDHDGISEDSSSVSNLILHAVSIFRNPFRTLTHIDSISAIIGDSGVEGGDGYYELELVIFSNATAVRTNTYTATGTTLTLTSAGDHQAGTDYLDFSADLSGSYVASGAYFGFIVKNSPKYLGHSLHIQVNVSREVGAGSY